MSRWSSLELPPVTAFGALVEHRVGAEFRLLVAEQGEDVHLPPRGGE
jgi:hypothetical protein